MLSTTPLGWLLADAPGVPTYKASESSPFAASTAGRLAKGVTCQRPSPIDAPIEGRICYQNDEHRSICECGKDDR